MLQANRKVCWRTASSSSSFTTTTLSLSAPLQLGKNNNNNASSTLGRAFFHSRSRPRHSLLSPSSLPSPSRLQSSSSIAATATAASFPRCDFLWSTRRGPQAFSFPRFFSSSLSSPLLRHNARKTLAFAALSNQRVSHSPASSSSCGGLLPHKRHFHWSRAVSSSYSDDDDDPDNDDGEAEDDSVRAFLSASGLGSDDDDDDEDMDDDEDDDDDDDDDALSMGEEDLNALAQSQSPAFFRNFQSMPTPPHVLVLPVMKASILPGLQGVAAVRDQTLLKDIIKLRKKHPYPLIGLFLIKNPSEAQTPASSSTPANNDNNHDRNAFLPSIDSIDNIHSAGVLAVVTKVVLQETLAGPAGLVYFSGMRRIGIKDVVRSDKKKRKNRRLTVAVKDLPDKPLPLPTMNGDRDKAAALRAAQTELEAIVHRLTTTTMNRRYEHISWSFTPQNPGEFADFVGGIITHFSITDGGGAEGTTGVNDQQDLIQELDVHRRLMKVASMAKREMNLVELSHKIKREIDQKLEERQRQMLLKVELKSIRTELGLEQPQTETLLAKFQERKAANPNIPAHALRAIDEELERFQHVAPASAEYNVMRTYLDWLTLLPWGKHTTDNLSMSHAERVLEEEHHGLKDVKDRLLEFIAVGSLRSSMSSATNSNSNNQQQHSGKILLLVGPPGVGKTSIGKSVAHALGREFFRFSVGGMTDEAEIKGHRRTYVGAMPGKLLQALKRVKTSNPVILIDEIDKIGMATHRGDPASALLEVLDPEQNNAFLDHYLDVSYDLSKVLFVCTANVTHTIPKPLLDRMEVIRLSGYVQEEKVAIAEKYLIPKAIEESGLSTAKILKKTKKEGTDEEEEEEVGVEVEMNREAVNALIQSYCREAGVRNLQKHIEKVFRKVAYKLVTQNEKKDTETTVTGPSKNEEAEEETASRQEGEKSVGTVKEQRRQERPTKHKAATKLQQKKEKMVVKESDLEGYLGKAPWTDQRIYDVTPPGVVMGLAWTSMGGSTPYVETVLDAHHMSLVEASHKKNKKGKKHASGQGKLVTTGSMGEVMKESANIAYTYAKLFMRKLDAHNDFFEKAHMHMHLPEGATPKDGPSAGITMVASLLSLAKGVPIKQNLAMTGEITLTGKVLPVGGIKEKVIAAKRNQVTELVIPKENKKDWDELDDFLRAGLTVHFADYFADVYKAAFE
ncbi:ATP-dependent Lon protease pim1 [Balamuthia mandrillaris]